jgi:hypothetical protein
MTPTTLQERLEASEGRIDVEAYLEAVAYVRDDGRH